MQLSTLDLIIILTSVLAVVGVGLWSNRNTEQNVESYFLSSRNIPWWLLGVSMVATTFAADTPNLVTDIVRKNGISGNWEWWAFLLTGMLTVFIYARLWRRSECFTDLEFYELRYSGKAAAFLRGFRALYLGVFFNVLVMANVCLAGVKIGSVLLGTSPTTLLIGISAVTIFYSALGGLKGVVLADFLQFFLALVGAIGAAYYVLQLPQIGSLDQLLAASEVQGKLNLLPDFTDSNQLWSLLIIPIAVQWWSVWYPGAEPGGGGYIAQRMLSAKSEEDAMGATLLFNLAHYALRPWPWIIVALASLVVFPTHDALQSAFPNIDPAIIDDDLAYPAMLSLLPSGLLGLVVASLIAALMSTLSTHLNWGSSYVCHDFIQRFVQPDISEKNLVRYGQLSTIVLMILAAALALSLENALEGFSILLKIGAGTGLLFILRWFWWRINAYSELTAMIVSFLVAVYFQFIHEYLGFTVPPNGTQLVLGVVITTVAWVIVTLLTRPTDEGVLWNFYDTIKPANRGWRGAFKGTQFAAAFAKAPTNQSSISYGILGMSGGILAVYSLLFGTGKLLYSEYNQAAICFALFAVGAAVVRYCWQRLEWK